MWIPTLSLEPSWLSSYGSHLQTCQHIIQNYIDVPPWNCARERIGLYSVIRHVSGTSYSCHAAENHAILKRITTQSAVLLCHCRHQSLLAVIGYASVPRDTSLSELDVAIRGLASALGSETTVTVIGLCAHGVLHAESKTVVHEFIVTNGIDRDTIHELYE